MMSFTICLLVLKQRAESRERTFHFITIIALFVLATLGLADNTALAVVQAGSYFYKWGGTEVEHEHAKTLQMIGHLLPAFR